MTRRSLLLAIVLALAPRAARAEPTPVTIALSSNTLAYGR
jgi:hypothetical protein